MGPRRTKKSKEGLKKVAPIFMTVFGRLMVPIFSPQGQVLGFGGRYLDPSKSTSPLSDKRPPPKYINSPETALFKKSQVLFGMNVAKRPMARAGTAVLVGGLLRCHRFA